MRIPSHLSISHTKIKKDMPNICQENERCELLRKPFTQCGPVAAANILIQLQKTKFKTHPQKLVEPVNDEFGEEAQFKLIEKLSKNMGTNVGGLGTYSYNLVYGIQRYARDRHYKAKAC